MTKTRIERLTGMATGAIENVFDIAQLTSLKNALLEQSDNRPRNQKRN